MSTFYTQRKQSIQLPAKPLGSGGQGAVYAVASRPKQVAKIYNADNRSQAQEKKLQIMLNNAPDNPTQKHGHESYAWVEDLLYDAQGSFAGFLMPKLDLSRSIILFEVMHSKLRRDNVTWEHMVHTAYNLASAVHGLHNKGYVIGDLNESNVLVTPQALVTIIDTDSMQVKAANGKIYRSPVGKAEYTAPELQGKDFSKVNRKEAHDCFALACLIFSLLMLGRHPFAGTGGQNIAESIQNQGSFAAFPKKYRPPTGTPALDILPDYILMLIQKCFKQGHHLPKQRPSAKQWRDALALLKQGLKQCLHNENHYYSSHLQHCPWCSYDQQNNASAFAPSVRQTHVSQFSTQQKIQTPREQQVQKLQGQQQPLNPTIIPTATIPPSSPPPTPTIASNITNLASANLNPSVNPRAMWQGWFGGVTIWLLWLFIGLLNFTKDFYGVPNIRYIDTFTIIFWSSPLFLSLLGTIFSRYVGSYKECMVKAMGHYIIATSGILAIAWLANAALQERSLKTQWEDWLPFLVFQVGGTAAILSFVITMVQLIFKEIIIKKNILLSFLVHVITYALLYYFSALFFKTQWIVLANFSVITIVALFSSVGRQWYRIPFLWFYSLVMLGSSIIFYFQPQGHHSFDDIFSYLKAWLW